MPTEEHPGLTGSITAPNRDQQRDSLTKRAERLEAEATRLLLDTAVGAPVDAVRRGQALATLALSLRLGAAQHADGTIHVFSE